MPLIGVRRSLSCLYSWNACEMPRTRASSRSETCVATTTTPATRGSAPRGCDQMGMKASMRSPDDSSRTVVTSWPASPRLSWLSFTSRSEEHTSELQSPCNLVCRLLLEKKKKQQHDDEQVRSMHHAPQDLDYDQLTGAAQHDHNPQQGSLTRHTTLHDHCSQARPIGER